ncbi:YqgE/AlgH family protein [Murinocardiopsis flavida]|nr:YqgE/AlgH family protein [Murinocardiopsis flavida]
MDQRSLTGHLLVATPLLEDPNFRRSVVFMIDDDTSEGSIGVIVNRPSDLPVSDVLAEWGGYTSSPSVMFSGGPVGAGSGLALGVPGAESAPLGWRPLANVAESSQVGGLGTIDLDTPPELLGDALGRLRVFAGYAGWSAGQLGDEIEEGAWYVLSATPDDVFCDEPGGLWAQVLRRQGGELALLATFPDDPTLN